MSGGRRLVIVVGALLDVVSATVSWLPSLFYVLLIFCLRIILFSCKMISPTIANSDVCGFIKIKSVVTTFYLKIRDPDEVLGQPTL